MQIYIKPELEQKLRQEENMSGLISELLTAHYKNVGTVGQVKPVRVEKSKRATGYVMDENKSLGAPQKQKQDKGTVPPATTYKNTDNWGA